MLNEYGPSNDRLRSLAKKPHSFGFVISQPDKPHQAQLTPQIAIVALSRQNARSSTYKYQLLRDQNYDTFALWAKIARLQAPQSVLDIERKLKEEYNRDLENIINKSAQYCAKEGLPEIMVVFGTTEQQEDVVYLYHPLKINSNSLFYIPPTRTLQILKKFAEEQQTTSN